MEGYTDVLVDFVVALKYEDLPHGVIEQTKLFVADYYAAFAGLIGLQLCPLSSIIIKPLD
jgi:adenosine deaminase